MTKDEMYQKHIDTMFGIRDINDFPPHKAEAVLDNLLQWLPNGGKLYKYRCINDDKFFNRVYNSLQEGTIWCSRADKFTDKTDCTICYDPLAEVELINKFFHVNPELVVRAVLRAACIEIKDKNPSLDEQLLRQIVHCYYEKTVKLDTRKALRLCRSHGCKEKESILLIHRIQQESDRIIQDFEPVLQKTVYSFLDFNERLRRYIMVCSLCGDYQGKSVWEHYAYNSGICIEYDYNKLKIADTRTKSFFCSTYKVRYVEDNEEFTFVPLIKTYLETMDDKSIDPETNKKLLTQMVTKSNDYAYEKEWRILHFDDGKAPDGVALQANIVSGIIMDEEALDSENGKKILALAKEKQWNIKVRKFHQIKGKYEFTDYNAYK